MAHPQSGYSSTDSVSNWNLECWNFAEGGKPENPEKNPQSKGENQQQTQPTYDAGSGNRTRATLVGGERSHHCAIPAPLKSAPNPQFNFIFLLNCFFFSLFRFQILDAVYFYYVGCCNNSLSGKFRLFFGMGEGR